MKRVGSSYHALHLLKAAETRLRKALLTNCKKELANCISECVLNVPNGDMKLSSFSTRKLQKHKAALCKVADRHMSLSGKKRLIVQRGVYLLPLLGAILPTIVSLIFRGPDKTCYVRCTSSRPIITIGTKEATGAPRLASGNIVVEAANTIRMNIGLRCIKRFARPISERLRRRKRAPIF